MLKIGWFSTGRGEGSRGLLRFVQQQILGGLIDARIEFVFSNRERGEAEGSDQYFRLVEEYGLPLVTLSSSKFRRAKTGRFSDHREEYDRRVMSLLSEFRPDICVLAGYMLIASGAMCRAYHLLNLHPALPAGPIGTWQEVIWELIETRATHTGAMVHLATEDVDRGPVISYCTVPITGKEFELVWAESELKSLSHLKGELGEDMALFQQIRQAQYQREPYLLLETLRSVAQGKVVLRDGQLIDGDGNSLAETHPSGLCLDEEIKAAMMADGVKILG
ncbi:MAG: hypothetical protein BZY75_02350 [SAR202 cluster bacterium Io17-Chloro-G7]|nr:MAG: hypothetical protein BZY75_02350 [SAR202 cluster bacterium Io17-Chloro-G7]